MTNEEAIKRLKEGEPFSELYNKMWEEALNMAIKALEDSRWISVKERLPKKKGYYLVTIFDDYRHISEICIEYWYGKRQGWSTAIEVTAWMPLPKSY